MILAIHEILPFQEAFGRSLINGILGPPTPSLAEPNPISLTDSRKETFLMTTSRTNKDPMFAIIKTFTFAFSPPSREDDIGPWARAKTAGSFVPDVGADMTRLWVDHRDSCSGIEDAILRSVVDVWEIEARMKALS
ncbi:uncharacterized protein BT62DRAFT_934679 [Guyanagaster necrorhizus]|uniref:Uncharacterized protein n=1 Tax=Guyanagaster necrorhizus TaxID=856835 RepID=A0A9P7VPM7_9AGAR|nr:uncharacterized protein BT62DRAFT_934679 [Guyanagaster necrorhizus MCA 3950]KAG7443726.1 hypothetical protein BT62DRAFT_934679 [Guyanagaster necrorhizus MCA 3950]